MFRYNNLDLSQTNDKIHIKSLIEVIEEYKSIIDVYNVDFFVDNHWSKLPKSWINSINNFEVKDIENLLSNKPNSCVLPLSLLSFRSVCSSLQLPSKSTDISEISLFGKSFPLKDQILATDLKNQKNKYQILTRKMKLKKRHEIGRLSHLIDDLMKGLSDCNTIIDCGSGQGHLSRVLSLCFGFDVISIESNENNVFGAHHKDVNCVESLKRYRITDEFNLQFPKKVNQLLDKNSSISELTENSLNHLLLGLHACGPLSNIIVNQFSSCSEAKAMILISCCYMKTDCKSFPMSQLVGNHCSEGLSYASKEMGCHAFEKFLHKLKNKDNLDSLKVHCFRAILESLIDKFCPNMRHKALKRVKITENMNFKEYMRKAVDGLNISIPDEELDSEYVEKCLKQEKNVLTFYSLRLLIAPLVETLILLDFINFLKEKGIRTALLPLFDPILSPRNNVLIAIK